MATQTADTKAKNEAAAKSAGKKVSNKGVLHNIKLSKKKNTKSVLLIEIDTATELGESHSGKNMVIAKSNGWSEIQINGMKYRLSLNLVTPMTVDANGTDLDE